MPAEKRRLDLRCGREMHRCLPGIPEQTGGGFELDQKMPSRKEPNVIHSLSSPRNTAGSMAGEFFPKVQTE